MNLWASVYIKPLFVEYLKIVKMLYCKKWNEWNAKNGLIEG